MQLRANNLDKMDFFGKSDPYLEFLRVHEDNKYVMELVVNLFYTNLFKLDSWNKPLLVILSLMKPHSFLMEFITYEKNMSLLPFYSQLPARKGCVSDL